MEWVGKLLAQLNDAAEKALENITLDTVLQFADDVWDSSFFRTFVFAVVVLYTIRIIASIYSGDLQNSDLGPVGIRPHAGKRLGADDIMVPRSLLPLNLDGVSAKLKVFFVYRTDGGKRVRTLLYTRNNVRIGVSAVKLGTVKDTRYGFEAIPDVATEDVCFPPIENDAEAERVEPTPLRAPEYVDRHKLIEKWTEDDAAPLVSLAPSAMDLISTKREEHIVDSAEALAKLRLGNFLDQMRARELAKKRANVIGSYYVKLEFSRDPFFILSKHPDKELKMTAWLTVLTSAFAILMELWPLHPDIPDRIRPKVRPAMLESSATISVPDVPKSN